MRRGNVKRLLALCLVLCTVLSVTALAVTSEVTDAARKDTATYVQKTVTVPQIGSIGGEWAVIGLARSDAQVPQSYWESYYARVEAEVRENYGVLHDKKYTEYSRVILALTAIGADPTSVGGYNLLTPLGDFEKTIWQGVNGPIWALIALDSGDYTMPLNAQANTQATRQMYVEEILSRQMTNGGWNLTGKSDSADPDITAMALQALVPYQDQITVQKAVDAGLSCLSALQNATGGYVSWNTENAESTCQVITALCSLGVSLEDSRFVKNGHSLTDALMSYYKKGAGFQHTADGSGANLMTTEQGLYTLVAIWRSQTGRSGLYEMDDVSIHTPQNSQVAGLPDKHTDVKKQPVTFPDITFQDITAHKNQSAIEALASRGIINGRDNVNFDPNATMTRAEFSAIVVRALGFVPQAGTDYSDVTSEKWYAAYVGTASCYGIIQGRGDGSFDPESKITRQEASLMVMRAAKLCGMNTTLGETEVRSILVSFSDYPKIAPWAQTGMAFCYDKGLFDSGDLNTEPERNILRCEIAQVLYNLLGAAELL